MILSSLSPIFGWLKKFSCLHLFYIRLCMHAKRNNLLIQVMGVGTTAQAIVTSFIILVHPLDEVVFIIFTPFI